MTSPVSTHQKKTKGIHLISSAELLKSELNTGCRRMDSVTNLGAEEVRQRRQEGDVNLEITI